jgi:hypothetical protein
MRLGCVARARGISTAALHRSRTCGGQPRTAALVAAEAEEEEENEETMESCRCRADAGSEEAGDGDGSR